MATTWWTDLKVVAALKLSFADFNFHRKELVTVIFNLNVLAISDKKIKK